MQRYSLAQLHVKKRAEVFTLKNLTNMSKNKRKRKLKEEDFKKKKLKVGKKLPIPDNATRTNFKARNINIVEQNFKQHGSEKQANFKGQKLKDLLNSCSHYNAQGREDALLGLKDLFERHPVALKDNLNGIFQRILALITDLESSVRKAFLAVMLVTFKGLSKAEISPFFPNIVAYLCSAMTHINESIRLDSLKFLDLCLKYFPLLVSANPKDIIQNFINVISIEKSNVSKSAGAFVKTELKAKVTSQKIQLEVLSRLNRLLSVVFADACDGNTGGHGNSVINSTDDPNFNKAFEWSHLSSANCIGFRNSIVSDSSHGNISPMMTSDALQSTNQFRICNPNPILISNFSMKAASEFQTSIVDHSWLMEFVSSMAPVLFEYWVECCPAEFCMNLIPIKRESVSLKIMKEILEIFVTLVESLMKNVSDQSLFHKYLKSKLFPLFNTHFIKVFPLDFTLQQTGRKPRKDDLNESITDFKLNILIAHLSSYYIPELKTNGFNLPRWISEVLSYLQKVLVAKTTNKQKLLTSVSDIESVTKLVKMFLLQFPEGFDGERIQLLQSVYELFDSAHPTSNKKRILQGLLGEIINSTSKQNTAMKAILDEWLKSSLQIVNMKEVSGDMKHKILSVCKSAIVQEFPGVVNAMNGMLPNIFQVENFSNLCENVQCLVIEILYHLCQVPPRELFEVLAKLCVSNSLSMQVLKYLMFVVHQLVHLKPSNSIVSMISGYLSLMLSLTIGHTESQLVQFQSLEKDCPVCYNYKEISEQNTIVAEFESDDGDPQLTEKSWKHTNEVIEIICSYLAQSDYSARFLEMLDDSLCKLFIKYPTLPLEVVYRLLYLVKNLLCLAKKRAVIDLAHLLGFITTWCSVSWHFSQTISSKFGKVNFIRTIINNLTDLHIEWCRLSETVLKGVLVSFIPCTLRGCDPQLTCKVLMVVLKELQGELTVVHQPTLKELHQNLENASKDGLLDSQMFSDFEYQCQCYINLSASELQ